jgi:hypothetical protein
LDEVIQVWFARLVCNSKHRGQVTLSLLNGGARLCIKVAKQYHKGFNSQVDLVVWWIWKHRNGCVFEGGSPSLNMILQNIRNEALLWCMARAKGLEGIWP